MKTNRIALFVLAYLLAMTDLPTHALSGNQWANFPPSKRESYIIGLTDAWQNIHQSQQYASRKWGDVEFTIAVQQFSHVYTCVVARKLSYAQMTAIIENYMRKNQSEWGSAMASIAIGAITFACDNPHIPIDVLSSTSNRVVIPASPPEALDDYRTDPTCRRVNGLPCGTMP